MHETTKLLDYMLDNLLVSRDISCVGKTQISKVARTLQGASPFHIRHMLCSRRWHDILL